jgi:hypothetical protein
MALSGTPGRAHAGPRSPCASPDQLVVDQPGGAVVAVLTNKWISRGVHRSARHLERAIKDHLAV